MAYFTFFKGVSVDAERATEENVFLNEHGLWSARPINGGESDWLQFKTEREARRAAAMTFPKAIRFQDKVLQRHLREPDLLRDAPPAPRAPSYGMNELRRHSVGLLRGKFSGVRSALLAPYEPHSEDALSLKEILEDAKRQLALAKVIAIYVWLKWRLAFLCLWHGLRMRAGAWRHDVLAARSRVRAKSRKRGFLAQTQSVIRAEEHEERAALLARMAGKKWMRVRQQLAESMRFDL